MRNVVFSLIVIFLCSCGPPYQDVPLAAPLSYTAGEEALAKGEFEEAARQFRAYIADDRPTYRARAYYQLARAQYHMEDYQGALESLATLEQEFPGFGNKQTEALKGDLLYALDEPTEAILLWEAAYDQSTAVERDALRPRIARAIDGLSADEATELASMLTVPQIYEMAIDRVTGPAGTTTAMAVMADTDGTDAAYVEDARLGPVLNDAAPPSSMPAELSESERSALEGAGEADAALGAQEESAEEEIVVASVDGDTSAVAASEMIDAPVGAKVAALLPLTGSARDAGRATLARLRQSLDDETLVTRDTGSDAQVGVELFEELAADSDVVAVLGPLHPPVIEAVTRAASTRDLPVLPLRNRATQRVVANPGRRLASYAVKDLQLSKIGILGPAPEAGRGFGDAAASMGATVVGTHTYDPDELDMNGVLAAVQTWIDAGGVEAVYVADPAPRGVTVAKAARAVAPQVVLLGDSTWANPVVLAADGVALEGAVITGNPPAVAAAQEDVVERVAAALQRAVALGETSRSQTRALLEDFDKGPAQAGLVKIVGSRATTIN